MNRFSTLIPCSFESYLCREAKKTISEHGVSTIEYSSSTLYTLYSTHMEGLAAPLLSIRWKSPLTRYLGFTFSMFLQI
jgi:hypothetical protein